MVLGFAFGAMAQYDAPQYGVDAQYGFNVQNVDNPQNGVTPQNGVNVQNGECEQNGSYAYVPNGGVFGYGSVSNDVLFGVESLRGSIMEGVPGIPGHGQGGNQNAPLGSGLLLLAGFGAAYALRKRERK